jgi:SAM-dependent methyltransferase
LAEVDDDAGAAGLLAFLDHFEGLGDVIARRERSYGLLGVRPGLRVVDVGCGAGGAVRELAARVTPGGWAAGVDVNEALLKAARRRAAGAGVEAAFHAASAEALPFAEGSLDGYRAERLFQHLAEPAAALAEAHRVLIRGGRLVLIDQAWDATLIDSDDEATTRVVVRAFRDGIVNGGVGSRYHRLLADAGFVDVKVEGEAAVSTRFDQHGAFLELVARVAEACGALEASAAAAWLEDQRERGRVGRSFVVMTHLLATGTR